MIILDYLRRSINRLLIEIQMLKVLLAKVHKEMRNYSIRNFTKEDLCYVVAESFVQLYPVAM